MYKILDGKIVYLLDDKIKGEVCFKIRIMKLIFITHM